MSLFREPEIARSWLVDLVAHMTSGWVLVVIPGGRKSKISPLRGEHRSPLFMAFTMYEEARVLSSGNSD